MEIYKLPLRPSGMRLVQIPEATRDKVGGTQIALATTAQGIQVCSLVSFSGNPEL